MLEVSYSKCFVTVLRRETLPLFYNMMEKEMKNSGNIKKVSGNSL